MTQDIFAQSFLFVNVWKCAENLCMKVKECLSLYFEISENIYGRGVEIDFEIEYLYVHNTLLKQHEVLKMYH